MSGVHNKHAGSLAALNSKVDISDEAADVKIMKRRLLTVVDLIHVDLSDEKDCRNLIIRILNHILNCG